MKCSQNSSEFLVGLGFKSAVIQLNFNFILEMGNRTSLKILLLDYLGLQSTRNDQQSFFLNLFINLLLKLYNGVLNAIRHSVHSRLVDLHVLKKYNAVHAKKKTKFSQEFRFSLSCFDRLLSMVYGALSCLIALRMVTHLQIDWGMLKLQCCTSSQHYLIWEPTMH